MRILLFCLSLLIWPLASWAQDLRPLDSKAGSKGFLLVQDQNLCHLGYGAFNQGLKLSEQELIPKDRPPARPRLDFAQTQELSLGCNLAGFLLEYNLADDATELEEPFLRKGVEYSHLQIHLERMGLGWGLELIRHRLQLDFYLGRYTLTYRLANQGISSAEYALEGSYGAVAISYHFTAFFALDYQIGQGLQTEGLGQFSRLGGKFHMRFE